MVTARVPRTMSVTSEKSGQVASTRAPRSRNTRTASWQTSATSSSTGMSPLRSGVQAICQPLIEGVFTARTNWLVSTSYESGARSSGPAIAESMRAASPTVRDIGPLAQGSDLGGSLRTPAAFCGVVGFRTTPGLVPKHPVELAWDWLSVAGPMARTVADVALMLSAIAGPDDRAPLSYEVETSRFVAAVNEPSIARWRVAWSPDLNGLIP